MRSATNHLRRGAARRRRRRGATPYRSASVPQPPFAVSLAAKAFVAAVVVSLAAVISSPVVRVDAAEFNGEIALRVRERLHDFLSAPLSAVRLEVEYRSNGVFEHALEPADREQYLRVNEVFRRVSPLGVDALFYGLESGVFVSTGITPRIATYREPGESGYMVQHDDAGLDPVDDNEDVAGLEAFRKHYRTCVDESGRTIPCDMSPGGPYIKCLDGCELVRCPDEYSQRDCEALSEEKEREKCQSEVKWCRNYEKRTYEPPDDAAAEDTDQGQHHQMGYVPRLALCIDSAGIPSQTPGQVVPGSYARLPLPDPVANETSSPSEGDSEERLGNCYYADNVTPVNRSLTGPYAYCGGEKEDGENKTECSGTFIGAYTQHDYDPRWRGWYEETRQSQKKNWSPPYVFFAYELVMGITYSEPMYSVVDGKNVFRGVAAVDYTLGGISEFLLENYINSSTTVAIFEENDPNYMIATSTGSETGLKVQKDDETEPCTDFVSDLCTVVRIKVEDLGNVVPDAKPMDAIVSRAFVRQRDEGFPSDRLVTVKGGEEDDGQSSVDSALFVSQTLVFELTDAPLKWRVLIVSPATVSDDDAITAGDPLFGLMIAFAVLGVLICLLLFGAFFRKRHTRVIAMSDWRFTSAFLLGCALMNVSTLSFLGPNDDWLCMSRMWAFHGSFALTFSPLFVKTYRMMKLVGAGGRGRRKKITHRTAAIYCLPIVAVQVVILTIFSVVDPSKQTEIIENTEPDVTQRIVCSHETNAFFITELVYEGGLLLLGCVLAFKTRHLKGDFGESRQLIFTMYDIAVVGSVIVIVTNVVGNYQAGRRVLYSIGIFWGTVFSSCVFVLPRLMRLGERPSTTTVSGLTGGAQPGLGSGLGSSGMGVSAGMIYSLRSTEGSTRSSGQSVKRNSSSLPTLEEDAASPAPSSRKKAPKLEEDVPSPVNSTRKKAPTLEEDVPSTEP